MKLFYVTIKRKHPEGLQMQTETFVVMAEGREKAETTVKDKDVRDSFMVVNSEEILNGRYIIGATYLQ